MTDEEKKLLDTFRKMKSKAIKNLLMSNAAAMVCAQEAIKSDYGLDLNKQNNPHPAA